MDSTEAIHAAIQFIQSTMDDEDNQAHAQEVITQLQRLPQASGSNYGTLWSIDDLRERRPAWSDKKLTAWMEDNWRNISDRQSEEGWETIGTLLEMDGLCVGCGEDDSRVHPQVNTLDVCPKCDDDYEITRCTKCDHVMRRKHSIYEIVSNDNICPNCS